MFDQMHEEETWVRTLQDASAENRFCLDGSLYVPLDEWQYVKQVRADIFDSDKCPLE